MFVLGNKTKPGLYLDFSSSPVGQWSNTEATSWDKESKARHTADWVEGVHPDVEVYPVCKKHNLPANICGC